MGRKPDYYEILGVPRTASHAEIRRAFRRLARELHPDINPSPDATKRMQDLNQAYHVLKDDMRRSMYDRGVYSPSRSARRSPPPPRPTYSAYQRASRQQGYTRYTYYGTSYREYPRRRGSAPHPDNVANTTKFLRRLAVVVLCFIELFTVVVMSVGNPLAARIAIVCSSVLLVLYGIYAFPKGIPRIASRTRRAVLIAGAASVVIGMAVNILYDSGSFILFVLRVAPGIATILIMLILGIGLVAAGFSITQYLLLRPNRRRDKRSGQASTDLE